MGHDITLYSLNDKELCYVIYAMWDILHKEFLSPYGLFNVMHLNGNISG